MNLKNFFSGDEATLEDLGGGKKRKITAFHENMMCVEVHFDTGAAGTIHKHPHEQITYILSGEFEFTVGEEKKILKAGDSTYNQSDVEHGAVCLQEGVLLDIFTPCRKDFLN